MNKEEFLQALDKSLGDLPKSEREKAAAFYEEAIADRMEDGMSEEEAVAALGSVTDAAEQTMMKAPFKALLSAGAIIGSPLWLPLLIAFAAVLFSIYVSVWAVIISLFAAVLAIAISGAGCVVIGLICMFSHPASGFAAIGAGFALVGAAILLLPAVLLCARYTVKLTTAAARGIKRMFIRKRSVR